MFRATGTQPKGPPDFEQTVKLVLTTFAVFTGFAIGKAIDSVASMIAIPPGDASLTSSSLWSPILGLRTIAWRVLDEPYFWALIAVLSLFLRFLIGSAIHLNDTYVKRVDDPGAPVSQFFWLLFKDLMFLLGFGIVALLIAKTVTLGTVNGQLDVRTFDVKNFAFGAMLFVLGGLLWSLVDLGLRKWIGVTGHPGEFRGGGAYTPWLWFDLAQLLVTWLYVWVFAPLFDLGVRAQIVPIALVYLAFLYLDINGLIQGLRPAAKHKKLSLTVAFAAGQPAIDAAVEFLKQKEAAGAIAFPNNGDKAKIATGLLEIMAPKLDAKVSP